MCQVDSATRQLFISDTGADRVLVVDVDSGSFGYDAKPIFHVYSATEDTFYYSVWHGILWSVLGSVPRPSGLALSSSTVYVGSYSTGAIHALDRTTGRLTQLVTVAVSNSILGLALNPAGGLVFADDTTKGISTVAVTSSCATAAVGAGACTNGVTDSGETDVDCGGTSCARCAAGQQCTAGSDCASGACASGVCITATPVLQDSSFLWNYLDSPFYANSFVHHLIHDNHGRAGYRNVYPIHDAGFCETAGLTFSNFTQNSNGTWVVRRIAPPPPPPAPHLVPHPTSAPHPP